MAAIAAANIQSPLPGEALDIGSGKGELIGAIRARFRLRPTSDWRSTCLQSGRTHQSDQLFLSRPCFARNGLRRSPAECRPLPAPLLAAVRDPFSANESRSPLLLATREE